MVLIFVLSNAWTFAGSIQDELRGDRYKRASQTASITLKNSDFTAYRDAVASLNEQFPNNSRWLRNRAAAEARLGNGAEATRYLRLYASMGLTLNVKDPSSQPLVDISRDVPGLQENARPLTKAQKLFSAPASDLVIEDIAYDPLKNRFFLSSIRKRKIIRCDANGHCADFVKSSAAIPLGAVLALHVDHLHRVLWATTAEMNAATAFHPERDGESSVLKFDLDSGRLIKRFETSDGRKHAMGDMTVAYNGDAFVSDGISGDVFVISHSGNKLVPLVPAGMFVSPQTPVLSADEKLLYVADYVGGIAVMRLSDRHIDWLTSNRPAALEGIDGMYRFQDKLIAIQNGTMPERIVAFRLASPTRIDQFEVLEANWPELGDPTHGIVIGDHFYFIANSGWDRVADDGSFTSGEVANVMKRQLR